MSNAAVERVREAIREARIVPIVRAGDEQSGASLARSIADAGAKVLEITMTTPGAANIVADLSRSGTLTGAGSVLTAADARVAVDAGARFLVSPVWVEAVDARARDAGVPYIAGAATPQEIFDAWGRGVRPVKVFPVTQLGGAAYIRAVLAPMPFLEVWPTGGILPADARAYFDAGAHVVGVNASSLAGVDLAALARGA